MVWRPAQQRSLWDSHLPSDQLPISSEEAGPPSSPLGQQQHGFHDTAPFSPRMHSPPPPRPTPPPAAPSQAPPAAASAPAADAPAQEAAADAGQAAIPYDWAISIDERGVARVDSEGGRLLVGSGADSDAVQQPDREAAGPPAASSSGAGSSLPTSILPPAGRHTPGDGPSAGAAPVVNSRQSEFPWVALVSHCATRVTQPHCAGCAMAGSLRGGQKAAGAGRAVEGQAAEAIAAMKEARAALGQGPMLAGVSSTSINSGERFLVFCTLDLESCSCGAFRGGCQGQTEAPACSMC
jgi:hypothetical protein